MTAYWGGQLFRLYKPHQRPLVTLGTENYVKTRNEIATPTSTNEIQGTIRFDAGNLRVDNHKTSAAIFVYSIQ